MSNDARLDKIEARLDAMEAQATAAEETRMSSAQHQADTNTRLSKMIRDQGERLDMAEKRHDILDDDLRQARDGFADMVQGVHNRVCKLESAANPSQPPTSPPTCRLCNGTKIESVGAGPEGQIDLLCLCLKVGDVVSPEIYNLLPVGSRVTQIPEMNPDDYYFERCKNGWLLIDPFRDENVSALGVHYRRILRIGPGDEAKHGGDAKEPTLSEVLAREDMRPFVDVVRAGIWLAEGWDLSDFNGRVDSVGRFVDALPPELRAAVEGVK